MLRPSRDQWAMRIVQDTATRGTCARRKVGCVLLDARGHVLATGYNGPASGQLHCIVTPCAGAEMPSGTGLELCEAVHAEQNALLQCRDVYSIATCYVSVSPCVTCVKLLLNTSCRRIVFAGEYPHDKSRELWIGAGREWNLELP